MSVSSGCSDVDRSSVLAADIGQMVAGEAVLPVEASVWTDTRSFYEQRENRPAWVTDEGTFNAAEGLQLLRTASEHGLPPAQYGDAEIAERIAALDQSKSGKDAPDRLQQLAELDARLTTALLALGRDVAVGRTTPESIDRRWKARREVPDLVGTLSEAAAGDLESWLAAVRPRHPEYAALQHALVSLQGQRDKGGWPKVTTGKFVAGKTSPSMVVLRQRLAAGGHLEGEAAASTSPVYSSGDEAAVKAFQALHQIPSTGHVDAATVAAMNVPIADRLRQVELNLER